MLDYRRGSIVGTRVKRGIKDGNSLILAKSGLAETMVIGGARQWLITHLKEKASRKRTHPSRNIRWIFKGN
jgi:hypothetical protein